MNLSINCKISLSKKLRSLVDGKECSIVLTTTDLINGKGEGRLSISTEGDFDPQIDTNETSIMITPISVSEEVPVSHAVGSIFSTMTTVEQNEASRRTVIDKIAVTKAPEKKHVPHAVTPKEEKNIPEEFKELNNNKCQTYITSLEDLLRAAKDASKNEVDIDIGSASNEREKAVLMELKKRGKSINMPAYIVNDKAGILSINDLDLTLVINAPINLANLSGKRVAESGELRGLLNAGIVKFISPAQAQAYINKMDTEIIKAPTLEVFDRNGAENNMLVDNHQGPSEQADMMELTMDDLDAPTLEESMIIDLTANTDAILQTEGRHTSVHGSTPRQPRLPTQPRKSIPQSQGASENPAKITIRKAI